MIGFAARVAMSPKFVERYTRPDSLPSLIKLFDAAKQVGTHEDRMNFFINIAPDTRQASSIVEYVPHLELPESTHIIMVSSDDKFIKQIEQSYAPHIYGGKWIAHKQSGRAKKDLEPLLLWIKNTFGKKPAPQISHLSANDINKYKRMFQNPLPSDANIG